MFQRNDLPLLTVYSHARPDQTGEPHECVGNKARSVKSGRGKGRTTPKGRQVDDQALLDVQNLLGAKVPRRDLLIEYLHLIQDKYGHLSAGHLRALAQELRLSQRKFMRWRAFTRILMWSRKVRCRHRN